MAQILNPDERAHAEKLYNECDELAQDLEVAVQQLKDLTGFVYDRKNQPDITELQDWLDAECS